MVLKKLFDAARKAGGSQSGRGGGLGAALRRAATILKGETKKVEGKKAIEEKGAVEIPSIPVVRTALEKREERDIVNTNIMYPLVPARPSPQDYIYAYANIRWSRGKGKPIFHVIEPVLTDDERRLLEELKNNIRERLDVDFTKLRQQEAFSYIDGKIDEALRLLERRLEGKRRQSVQYYLHRDFIGMGRIEAIMHDPNVEDISCDGVNIPLFVAHRNPRFGSIETNVIFNDADELDSFVMRLAQRGGKSISMANPIIDAALPDGSRLQATLATDIAKRGSNFTIRKFTEKPMTPIDLIDYGTLDSRLGAYLWLLIDGGSSLMVSGGTATGKTSILNSISMFVRPELKIISIEDTPELRLSHPNWVPEVAREAIGGEGKVDLFLLLKESLRQRPDYIIVGEVRGKEAFVLFQQIATGHPGLSTIHAEDMQALVDRLTTPPISLPPNLLENLDAIVFLSKVKYRGYYVRRVRQIVEVRGFDREKNLPVVNEVFRWDTNTDTYVVSGKSYLLGKMKEERGMTMEEMKNEVKERAEVLEWVRGAGIRDYREFARVVNAYYTDKERVLGRIRREVTNEAGGKV